MRLSKEAREKVKEATVLYEQALYFTLSIEDPIEDDVIDVAFKNIQAVLRDIKFILSPKSSRKSTSSSLVDDVSSIIMKNSSKVENELIYICENCHRIKTKQVFQEFILHFKQADLSKYKVYFSRYAPDNINSTRKEKEKAPQLTELERKQKEDDEEKCRVYQKKLDNESNHYNATLRFILSFIRNKQVTNHEDYMILLHAYSNIGSVDSKLRYSIKADEVLCEKDLSLMLTEYRSKVENELQGICDNVSNLTVQEAYTKHLDDFRTGVKLSAQDHHSHLQNLYSIIMSSKPKMSVKKKKKKSKLRLRGKGGLGSCKTPSLIDLHMDDYPHAPRHRHDHSDCCMKNHHLETSYTDWHTPIRRITEETKYPRRVFVCDDDSS